MRLGQANWPVRGFVIQGWVERYWHNSFHRLDCYSGNSYDPGWKFQVKVLGLFNSQLDFTWTDKTDYQTYGDKQGR